MSAPLPYKRTFNRISLLPVSLYCPLAAQLSEEHGAGRGAFMSRAFHANLAGQPEAPKLMALLDDEEAEEVRSWQAPATIVLKEGDIEVTLDYESSEKELRVGIDSWGFYCDPDSPACVTKGTLDFAWVRMWGGLRVAYVADVKKSDWTTLDGPESLQVHAYALAYASKVKADAYVTGIWVAEAGFWRWGSGDESVVYLGSERAEAILAKVLAAAQNIDGEAVTGQHCRDCWGRTHCPEHTLAAVAAPTVLAPVAAGGDVTAERALECLLALEAGEEIFKKARANLKEMVKRGLKIIDPVTGKEWKQTMYPGKRSTSVEAVVAAFGEDAAQKAIKRGAPYPRFGWGKP